MKSINADRVKKKGWKQKDLATWWGLSPRQVNRILGNDDQMTIDAVNGLPEFRDELLNRDWLRD